MGDWRNFALFPRGDKLIGLTSIVETPFSSACSGKNGARSEYRLDDAVIMTNRPAKTRTLPLAASLGAGPAEVYTPLFRTAFDSMSAKRPTGRLPSASTIRVVGTVLWSREG